MGIDVSSERLQVVRIEPQSGHCDAVVIWLHGLGAEARDFVALIEQLKLPSKHTIRFIFPNAPCRPISINGGLVMRGWYDIFPVNFSSKEDTEGIKKANRQIQEMINREIEQEKVLCDRILLGGFSQGGALALYTGLRFTPTLGGIVALSAYQPLNDSLAFECHADKALPIFMGHGLFDHIVPFNLGQMTSKQLHDLNYVVDWHSYPIKHTLHSDEIIQVGCFIIDILS